LDKMVAQVEVAVLELLTLVEQEFQVKVLQVV
jgi:hypothetical protein